MAKKKAKSGRKNKTTKSRNSQSDEAADTNSRNERGGDDAAEEAAPGGDGLAGDGAADASKLLFELNLDELRKESIKLGLSAAGEKPKKEVCIMDLSIYLSRHNFDPKTFKFAPKGMTKFPQILLDTSGTSQSQSSESSSSSSDDDSTDSEEERRKEKKKKKKKSKRRSGSPPPQAPSATHVILPPGWHILSHPVSGVPIGMLDPSGVMRSLEGTKSATTPTPTVDLTGTTPAKKSVSMSDAASLLGGRTTFPGSSSSAPTSRTAAGINSPANVDYCGMSVPGFVYNQEQNRDSTTHPRKLISGMYSNGKKEVIRKAMYAHHGVDSNIKPNGVNYEDMSWQDLGNGYTALILAQCDDNTSPRVVNMLKHVNRLFAYGLVAPLSSVLELDSGYMLGIENMTQDWSDGKRMDAYHDRQLHSLKLATKVHEDNKNKNAKDDHGKDNKASNKGERCSKDWIKKQNICFLYQNDRCDESGGHDDGNGTIVAHCCAWCAFNNKGFQAHNNPLCENRSNPFRGTRTRGGRQGTGNQP